MEQQLKALSKNLVTVCFLPKAVFRGGTVIAATSAPCEMEVAVVTQYGPPPCLQECPSYSQICWFSVWVTACHVFSDLPTPLQIRPRRTGISLLVSYSYRA